MSIEDPYTAWCIDEAIATVIAYLRAGKKPKREKTAKSNRELIDQIRREQAALGYSIVQDTTKAAT